MTLEDVFASIFICLCVCVCVYACVCVCVCVDMLEKGFEWTLRFGEPLNPPRLRKAPQPTCCSLKRTIDDVLTCSHCWAPLFNSSRPSH